MIYCCGSILQERYIAVAVYRKNDISLRRYIARTIYQREAPISRRIIVATHRLYVRYIAEISSIYRKDKERYSVIIICITFAQYCINTQEKITHKIAMLLEIKLFFEEHILKIGR